MTSSGNANESSQTRQLVQICVGLGLLLILAAIALRSFGNQRSPSTIGQAPVRQGHEGPGEATTVPFIRSPNAEFKPPVYDSPHPAPNKQPWKDRFPREELIEAEELAKPENLKQLVILDACPKSQYESRHVPGAIWLDHLFWCDTFVVSRNQNNWEEIIGNLGIDVNSRVVVYDDGSGTPSTRIRTILLYWGLKDVRVLEGGWPAWQHEGAYQDPVVPQVTPRPCSLSPNPVVLSGNGKWWR
jgi:rhodanese-related sulfurtransferase